MLLNFCKATLIGERISTKHHPRYLLPKLLLVMKMTAFLMLVACLHISAAALSQGVTLAVRDAPLQKVFIEISRQTGVSIVCNETLLKGTAPVTINVKDVTIQQALDICIKNQPIIYTIRDNNIIIKSAGSKPPLLPALPPWPQTLRCR